MIGHGTHPLQPLHSPTDDVGVELVLVDLLDMEGQTTDIAGVDIDEDGLRVRASFADIMVHDDDALVISAQSASSSQCRYVVDSEFVVKELSSNGVDAAIALRPLEVVPDLFAEVTSCDENHS